MLFVVLLAASPWLAASPGAACGASPADQMALKQSATVTSVRYDLAPPLSLQVDMVPELQAALTANASMADHPVQELIDAVLGMAKLPSATYAPNLKIWSHAGTTDKEGPIEAHLELVFIIYGVSPLYRTQTSHESLEEPGLYIVEGWVAPPPLPLGDPLSVLAEAAPNHGTVKLEVRLDEIPAAAIPRCGETRASTGLGTLVTSVSMKELPIDNPPPVTLTIDNVGNNGGFRVHCERQVNTSLDYEFTELATETSHAGTLNVLCQ